MPIVVTGASGRIGRVLRQAWKGLDPAPIWLCRTPLAVGDLVWDIAGKDVPDLPQGAVIVHLAGTTRGDAATLLHNVTLTKALARAALRFRARQVFLASSVAVYRPGARDIRETDATDPTNPYGVSKLAAEGAARLILSHPGAPGLTALRIGNVAGADALLGNLQPDRPVLLDPVAGQSRGPIRSYIGPQVLAEVLAQLVMRAGRGDTLPDVLNVAQAPAVAMADLLDAADQPWRFGPARPDVVARVAVSVDRLAAVVALPAASAHSLVADWRASEGSAG